MGTTGGRPHRGPLSPPREAPPCWLQQLAANGVLRLTRSPPQRRQRLEGKASALLSQTPRLTAGGMPSIHLSTRRPRATSQYNHHFQNHHFQNCVKVDTSNPPAPSTPRTSSLNPDTIPLPTHPPTPLSPPCLRPYYFFWGWKNTDKEGCLRNQRSKSTIVQYKIKIKKKRNQGLPWWHSG